MGRERDGRRPWQVRAGEREREDHSAPSSRGELVTQGDPVAAFLGAMVDAGIGSSTVAIHPDGRLHRFDVPGDKKGSKNGFYILHLDERPAGVYGSWKLGIKETWKADGPALSDFEREKLLRDFRKAEQRRAREEERKHAEAAVIAQDLWDGYQPAPADHPYLKRKGIEPHGARVDGDGRLVLPLCDYGGKIWSLQTIDNRGKKLFLPDGRVTGRFFWIGDGGKSIVIAEGFATAASIYESAGIRVAVAYNSGNLEPVAKAIRKAMPDAHLVIAADNDSETHEPIENPGVHHARKAADAAACAVAIPQWSEPSGRKLDFNELLLAEGHDAVTNIIGGAFNDQQDHSHAEPTAVPVIAATGEYSHDALALEFGERQGENWRYVDLWGHWYNWAGTHWRRDDRRLIWTLVRDFLRERAVGQDKKLAEKLRSADTVAAVVNLARSNREFAAGTADWDCDPWLLGTPGGTVDLRTGKMRAADPRDHITKLTTVAPAPPGMPAPIWTTFLARVFAHDPLLIPFVRRALGYALTGEVREHALFFAWGQGGNGKGVLFNTASGVVGDYAAIAPPDLLLVSHSDRHPTDLAMLRGARLVTAQELGANRQWDEPKLKSLTGGDPITARFMRQNFFTYQPQFSLFIAGNHKPSFRGVDEAIRRRMLLLPFLQNIPVEERDQRLSEKLRAEWPAILRWMIDGCLEWQAEGLNPPESVRAATVNYLEAEDILGQWLDDKCVVSPSLGWTALTTLYASWKGWCEARGQNPGTSPQLSRKLDERGLHREKKNVGAGFWGIAIVPIQDVGDGSDGPFHIDRSDRVDVRAGAHVRMDVSYGSERHYRHNAGDEPQEFDL